ncbi:MAG: ParB/RepB/Spo0J family partition protein [Paracoccus sp. (in: a-proteobacteria)]
MRVPVGHISNLNRIRKADKDQVARIAESIKEVGLINPITVSPARTIFNGQQIDGYQLIAGLHRLEACKAIGWDDIPVSVMDIGEQQRIIAECDENLCGTNLSASDRAEFTARRKEAYEALHPETKNGRNQHEGRDGEVRQPSFAADQADKTGRSARSVREDAERGSKVCKEALDILKGTKADTGTVLDALKDLPPEQQVVAAYQEVQKRQQPRQQGESDADTRRRSVIDADVKERAAKEVAAMLAEHVPGEWWDAVKSNLYAAGAKNIATEFTNVTGQSVMDKGGWL